MLYTYHQKPVSVLLHQEDIEQTLQYTTEAIKKLQERGEVKDPTFWARNIEAHRLACIAFARYYNKQGEWKKNHARVSPWTPDVDFTVKDQECRIIGVLVNENFNFGYKVVGKVWERDYNKGHDVYVLAAVFVPYVDFIGWLGRDSLQDYKRIHTKTSSYDLQEAVTRPMSQL